MRLELTDPTQGESEAGRCWTRTNISEAVPEVMSPFCWTFWARADAAATRRAWADFGLIPASEVDVGLNPNRMITGCFYGRQAINVDEVRQIVARAPGASADDFERDILGYVRPDAPAADPGWRHYPAMAVKFPAAIVRQRRRMQALHDEQLAWWRRDVLGESPRHRTQHLLLESTQRFHRAIRLHLYSRNNLLPAVQGPLTAIALEAGGQELVNQVLGGLGDIREAMIAGDLWRISRQQLSIEDFLRDHGFHGPAEGNPIATVWRENPAMIRGLADAYTRRADGAGPANRAIGAQHRHEGAVQQLLAAVPLHRRLLCRLMLHELAVQIRFLGLGKAAFLMGLDGARAAVRQIGAQLTEQGVTNQVDDAFYLTHDELLGPVAENVAEVVAFRRRRREQYQRADLPVTWFGMPEPERLAGIPEPVSDKPTLKPKPLWGAAGSSGVVEGTVLIVHDPAELDDIPPGTVVVCRYTDPSWAAILPLAEAIVIDIGGPASHGAVVARELGIPCVIGTDTGMRYLHDGDQVRVDGSAGSVEILQRPPTSGVAAVGT